MCVSDVVDTSVDQSHPFVADDECTHEANGIFSLSTNLSIIIHKVALIIL